MRLLSTSLIFTLLFIRGFSQTYFPFPASATHATWSVEYGYYDMTWGNQVINGTMFYGLLGDTTIDSNVYAKVYRCGFTMTSDTAFNPATAIYCFGIRESNKQIFIRYANDTIEQLHYDFNLAMGDSFYFYYAPMMGWHYVTSVDSLFINGSYRHTITFDQVDTWIEGIGSDAGLFESNMLIGNLYTSLLCYSENGNVIYSPLGDCNRSGTWINEVSNSLIKVYPNPANNVIEFNVPSSFASFKITVTDFLGQLIYTGETSPGQKSILNTSTWSDGVYFIVAHSSTSIFTGKAIIRH